MRTQKSTNNIIAYLFFLIIPLLIFVTSVLIKNIQGPSPQRSEYDPDYIYLINSLNISQFKDAGNVDHPGIPVQVIGALVIILKYNLGIEDQGIVKSVLSNPYDYVNVINKTLVLLISVALFFLGLIVYKIYRNIFLGIFFQMSCFISPIMIYHISKVSPDPFLIFIILCLIILIFYYIKQVDISPKKQFLFTLGFSLLTGLGVATKIIFIPLLFIPFILLPGIKQKILYIALSIISFFIFVMPAFSSDNNSYFLNWVIGLATHKGNYGTGEEEILNFFTISQNLQKLIATATVFIIIYLIIFITLVIRLFFKNKFQLKSDIHFKILLGVFISMTLQIFLVAKHYGNYGARYLTPSFMVSILGLYLCIIILSKLFQIKILTTRVNILYSILIIVFLLSGIYYINTEINRYLYLRSESKKFINFIEKNYPDAIKITSYGVSSPEFALYYGINFAGSRTISYKTLIGRKYSSYLFWGLPMYDCYTFEGSNNVNTIISSKEKIIFLCNNENWLNQFIENLKTILKKPNITLEKKFSNGGSFESVYEIKLE